MRRLIDPMAPAGRFVGLTNFGGFTRGAALDVEREAWHMIFGRRAFFGYYPAANGDVVWFVNWPRDPIGPRSAPRRPTTPGRISSSSCSPMTTARPIDLIRAGELELAARQHLRPGPRAGLAPRTDGHHRRRRARALADVRAGRIDGRRGRGHPRQGPPRPAVDRRGPRRVRAAAPRGASRRSSRSARGAAAPRCRDGSAGSCGTPFLRVVFRFFVTERSMAWQFDHRVEWDRRLAAATAVTAWAPLDR